MWDLEVVLCLRALNQGILAGLLNVAPETRNARPEDAAELLVGKTVLNITPERR